MTDDPPIDVAHAALLEAGRPDLAALLVWHYDDETDTVGFLDLLDDETDDGNPITRPDWDLVDRAEDIARASIGLPPNGARTVTLEHKREQLEERWG